MASGNTAFAAPEGVLYTADMKKLLCYPAKRPGATYVIPEGVESLAANALQLRDDSVLKTLVFPTTLLSLEGNVM